MATSMLRESPGARHGRGLDVLPTWIRETSPNLTAGANFGYLLVWVLVVANAMAVLVHYQSAKPRPATGLSLAELLARRLGMPARRRYWPKPRSWPAPPSLPKPSAAPWP